MAHSPARFAIVRELFENLVGCTPETREARLTHVRREDTALASDVTALLAAHGAAPGFLESPIVTHALTWTGNPGYAPAATPGPEDVGDVVSHYRLEQRIGAGGMGVVYRASDIALGRAAVIKVLAGPSTPELQRRLKVEAAVCARLQHPAIATFFESGEADGRAFIAMEFVSGPTLRACLEHGRLSVEQAIAIAASVLEALSHAHAAGVLHRDIKPENVIVTSDRSAKLLDFGIASLLMASDAETAPHVGETIAGTVGYMSPEQIRNDSLDPRSDVFQVATVLYEMLAGRPAFPGCTAVERLAAVLTSTPPPLDVDGVDEGLSHTIFAALAKEPAQRPSSAGVFLASLQSAAEGVTVALPDSMAILPLQNTGPAQDDWIGSGIAETLAEDLSRHPGLTIVRRERLAGALRQTRSADAQHRAIEVASILGCRRTLTGSYLRLGSALRLEVMLLEVSTGAVVFHEHFDGTLDAIFAMKDRIAIAVLNRVASSADGELGARHQPTMTAYEHYARGNQLAQAGDRGAFDRAREHFEAAVALESSYADALVGLARLDALSYTFNNDARVLQTSMSYSTRAIECDPGLAQAYVWRGYALMRLGCEEEAQSAFARARALDPSEIFAYYFAGGPGWTRRIDATIALAQQAVTMQPKFGPQWWALGSVYTAIGHYDRAQSCFDRCARLRNVPGAHELPGIEAYWAECLRRQAHFDDARRKCLDGLEAVERTDFLFRDSVRVFALVTLGRIALGQNDLAAAEVAFKQAIEHVQGRPRMLAGGTLWVRAHAHLAMVQRNPEYFLRAADRFEKRDTLDFSWLNLCDDYETCAILSEAAFAVGNAAQADHYRERGLRDQPQSSMTPR